MRTGTTGTCEYEWNDLWQQFFSALQQEAPFNLQLSFFNTCFFSPYLSWLPKHLLPTRETVSVAVKGTRFALRAAIFLKCLPTGTFQLFIQTTQIRAWSHTAWLDPSLLLVKRKWNRQSKRTRETDESTSLKRSNSSKSKCLVWQINGHTLHQSQTALRQTMAMAFRLFWSFSCSRKESANKLISKMDHILIWWEHIH